MEFRNHTPFPALAYAGIDQYGQAFHVVTLRQTLTWNDQGKLSYTDDQAPLCVEDSYFDDILTSSVQQESDLCHYKPQCDVIVNALAHAPGHKPQRRFQVELKLLRPEEPPPLPAPPQGLNPLQQAPMAEHEAWKAACERISKTPPPERELLKKRLIVTGEREFVRRLWPRRLLGVLIKWITLGGLRPKSWRLTQPRPVATLPLRNEWAFGGQSRIDQIDPAAKRVRKRNRLTPAQQAEHPDGDAPAEKRAQAHEAFAPNPIGRGWARKWYLKAKRIKRLPAPQVENPAYPVTSHHFELARRGKLTNKVAAKLLAGFGVRPKGHPERARLVGTIDPTFIASEAWLPEDFDFAVWNAAWPDQQTDYLQGNEIIELTNLCATDAPAAKQDAQGNTRLRLELPGDLPFILVRYAKGQIGELNTQLDTLIIEPQAQRLSCVWRATLAQEPKVRVLEARLLKKHEIENLKKKAADNPARQVGHG
jgi:hypothetical protein